jgi:hypothetical protein
MVAPPREVPPPIIGGDPIEATDDAFLGFATLDLQEWPIERLVLGTWVERPIDNSQVDTLYQAFLSMGFKPFAHQAHLLLIVPATSVANRHQLWLKLKDTARPPVIRFTPETKVLAAAGGQHRLAALAKYIVSREDRKKSLEARLESDPDDTELADSLQRVKAQLEATRWWGIQVYDKGAWLYWSASTLTDRINP